MFGRRSSGVPPGRLPPHEPGLDAGRRRNRGSEHSDPGFLERLPAGRPAVREAMSAVRAVARVVNGWQAHLAACAVTAADIELYAEQIDRPFPGEQRDQAMTVGCRC